MKNQMEENLDRKIKKNVYGKGQSAKVIFPAGFGTTAIAEVKFILNNLWFPQKFQSECTLLKNEIHISNIHMSALTELMMRCQCITDIRLIIFQGKAFGKDAFEKQCRSIPWNIYLDKNISLKIKVDSIASKAFHETGLKEILSNILKDNVSDIVSGENTTETTNLIAELYKDKLSVSISLAGDQLYKRGYRGILSSSAPLREDATACCIQKSLLFAKKINENFSPNTVVLPFSGTGTFAFEYIISAFHLTATMFDRNYALQKMPLFRQENFQYLLKKARENCILNSSISVSDNMSINNNQSNLKIVCIDNSKKANSAFIENMNNFSKSINNNGFHISDELFYTPEPLNENFLKMDFSKLKKSNTRLGNIFIPLNPPYGVRLGGNSNSISLYKNIAVKINEISILVKEEKKNILGFILCPNEETWSVFCRSLNNLSIETYHFTQGGMDIRVCQFYI